MAKFQIDGSALAIAILAAAVGFGLLSGPFSWLASIIGLILAIILFAFDREGVRSLFESLGFSAAIGLCLTLASAVLFRAVLANQGQPTAFDGRLTSEYLPLFWLAATVFVWVVDRSRMSGRVTYPVPMAPAPQAASPMYAPTAASHSFIPHNLTPPPQVVPAAPLRTPEPQPTPAVPVRVGAFTHPSFASPVAEAPIPAAVAPPMTPAPSAATSTPPHPVVPPAPIQPPAAAPAYSPAPSVPVASAPTPPQPVQIPPGKEATVYVTLVGEGLNVLRAVRAEHLGRDYYRIVEEMPAGEVWQFGPGQVVRCKKKNLSSGKAMVAMEEAPRAAQ